MDASVEREPVFNKLLRMVRKHGGSDLYLEVGAPVSIKLQGAIRKVDMPLLAQEDLARIVSQLLYSDQSKRLEQGETVNFVYAFEEAGDTYSVRIGNARGQYRLAAHRLGGS
jgi:twitching motility protein PilU